ncbi:MAG: hypothetical protein QM594_04935 [Niabella sp.]
MKNTPYSVNLFSFPMPVSNIYKENKNSSCLPATPGKKKNKPAVSKNENNPPEYTDTGKSGRRFFVEELPLIPSSRNQRNRVLAGICVLGCAGILTEGVYCFKQTGQLLPLWFAVYSSCFAATGVLLMVAVYKVKKWSIAAYALFVLLHQAILLLMQEWSLLFFLFHCALLIAAWRCSK